MGKSISMRIRRFTCLFSLKKYCFFLAIAGTLISYLAYLTGHPFRSRIGIIGVLLLGFAGCFLSALEYQKINRQTAIQMFWIYFIFTALWDLAAFSEYSAKTYPFVIVLGLVTLNLSSFFWFFVAVREKDVIEYIIEFTKRNKYLILLIVLFVVLSIETINDWLKIDSYSYYTYIRGAKAWDFTFGTFRLLQYCSHNAFGYSLFSLIGEYLLPGNGYGVKIIQIIMACLTIVAFSNITRKLNLDHANQKENILITSIFSFSPLFLGLLFEVALDFPTACFFVWFLYSYLCDKKIYEIATVFLLIFSKETGILLLFGFAIGLFLKYIITLKPTNLIKLKLFWKYVLLFSIAAGFYLMVFFGSDIWSQDENSLDLSLNGSELYKFGINIDNIFMKSKEFFVLNFSWIIWLLILIGFIFSFKQISQNLKTNEIILEKPVFLPFLCSEIVFFIFNLIYITYCNPRYITPFFAIFILLFAMIVGSIKKYFHRIVIYISVSALLLCQNFITIDPLTSYCFKNISIGKGKIITTRTFGRTEKGALTTDESIWSKNEMTHAASYNRQYSYFGGLFEKFLKEISYSEDTLIVIAPTYGTYMTKLALFGKWDNEALYYYNPTTGHVVLDEQQLLLNLQVIDEQTELDFSAYERIFLVYFPYREQYYNVEPLLNKYEILDTFDVEYRQWLLHAYKLK